MQSEKTIDLSLFNIRDMILMLPVNPPLQNSLLTEIDQATFYLNNRDFPRVQNCLKILVQKISIQLRLGVVMNHPIVPLVNEIQELQHNLTGLSLPRDSTARMEPNELQTTIEPLGPVAPDSTAWMEPNEPQTTIEPLGPVPPDSTAWMELNEPQTIIETFDPILSDSTMTPVPIAVENAKKVESPVKAGYLKWNFPSNSSIRK